MISFMTMKLTCPKITSRNGFFEVISSDEYSLFNSCNEENTFFFISWT